MSLEKSDSVNLLRRHGFLHEQSYNLAENIVMNLLLFPSDFKMCTWNPPLHTVDSDFLSVILRSHLMSRLLLRPILTFSQWLLPERGQQVYKGAGDLTPGLLLHFKVICRGGRKGEVSFSGA